MKFRPRPRLKPLVLQFDWNLWIGTRIFESEKLVPSQKTLKFGFLTSKRNDPQYSLCFGKEEPKRFK